MKTGYFSFAGQIDIYILECGYKYDITAIV